MVLVPEIVLFYVSSYSSYHWRKEGLDGNDQEREGPLGKGSGEYVPSGNKWLTCLFSQSRFCQMKCIPETKVNNPVFRFEK